jgi:putative aldouronate transport system substrate-binding protein
MNVKHVLPVLLMCALTLSLFATGNQETTGAAGTQNEIKKISILNGTAWPIPSDVDVNDNRWANVYKEGLPDVDINWIIVPSNSLTEKINILMASGEMPDLVPCNDTDMINWAENGLIVPLDKEVAQYFPNQTKFLGEAELKFAFYNGKQYRLLTPKTDIENPVVMEVRTDWLEALGKEVPTTLDEAMDLMKAFTFEDPDGNGKDDTIGFSGSKNLGLMQPFINAYGVNEGFWSNVDGTILPDIILPEMKEALKYIREMYAAGVYDKDSLVQVNSQAEEKDTAGITGFVTFYSWGTASRITPALREKGMDLKPLPPLKSSVGTPIYPRSPGIWGRYAVTVKSEYPEVPVRIMNWLMDYDTSVPYKHLNSNHINSGDLGVHSEMNSVGTFVFELSRSDNPQAEYDSYRHSYRLMGGYAHIAPPEELAAVRLNGPEINAVFPYSHYSDRGLPGPVEAELWGDLQTYYDEIKMKIVTGTVPLDEFDNWVEFFYANGGSEIVDEVNKLN